MQLEQLSSSTIALNAMHLNAFQLEALIYETDCLVNVCNVNSAAIY